MLARAVAAVGLAAIMTIGMIGTAQAAPADRAGDPVVLTGKDLPSLKGSAPDRVAAFKWDGRWQQVPVQIDERHVVKALSLYPDQLEYPTYITGASTFSLNIYADPRTRSGADRDPTFDDGDELVFMAEDAGAIAPATASLPAGMATAATRLKVADPLGGDPNWIYLFRANNRVDQSARQAYVKYDFKLTGLPAGQSIAEGYRYQNGSNHEDSAITTRSYRLHSFDRWIEDELRVTAGDATGVNILDREAVSGGGLDGCSRSEYTFSGNWDLDTSSGNDDSYGKDEGSYLTVKEGPVRAIRSFIGANSGPFVQKTHFYYADSEQVTIDLRVHAIPHLYVWTDLSEQATGMTFRDQKNQNGVQVDGIRDTLDPFGGDDFADQRFVWQQVSGAQGTVTTLTNVHDDFATATPRFNPPAYESYYLDASDPNNGMERQCGGDLKAFGAHGFGLKGMVPNTDPALAALGAATVQVNRIRHFDAPGGGATEAETYKQRANTPLTTRGAVVKTARLKSTRPTGRIPARRGKTARIKVRVNNPGAFAATGVKVCVRSNPGGLKGCARAKRLKAGGKTDVVVKTRVEGRVLKRKKATVTATVTARGLPKTVTRNRLRVR